MTEVYAASPQPTYRLIASRFPPIGLFDTIATAADLEPVMELAGWTNDRLVAERIARLPQTEWVYGRPNASIIMAAFLHVGPAGGRFNAPELGAWYASAAWSRQPSKSRTTCGARRLHAVSPTCSVSSASTRRG